MRKHVRVSEVADGVVEVRMMRPERRNALMLEVLEELSTAVDGAVDELGARVILLAGEGPSFCAGADLTTVHNPELGDRNQVGLGEARLWEQLSEVPVPVIAVVQGHAITGGLHLALCCDLIIAAEDAVFQDTHARLGLVPGSGEPQRYSRRLGIMLARELLITSRPMTGREAAQRGIAVAAVAPDELHDAAVRLATQIATNSARAIRYIKQMINGGFGHSYGEAQWRDRLLNWGGRLNANPDEDTAARLRAFRDRKRERTR